MYIYVPSGKMIKNYFWRLNAPWFPFPIFTSHIAMKKEKKTEEKKIAICTLGLTLWNQNWDSQQGRELATSGSNNFFFQFCQSYSYVNRKVWYHQIWIPNNLDFMVLILMYVPTSFVCIVFKSEVNGVKVHLDLDIHFWSRKYFCWNEKPCICKAFGKVIYTKYSKHWPYTVAHTFDCLCSKIDNSWFNPWFSFYFSSLYPAPYIEWYMC